MSILASQTLSDSAFESQATDAFNYHTVSQVFVVPAGYQWEISNISVKLYRSADGAGDATIDIVDWYGVDIPPDAIEGNGIAVATITTSTDGAFYDFPMGSIPLVAGTYAIRLNALTGGGAIYWRVSSTGPYVGGSIWGEFVEAGVYSSAEETSYDGAFVITGVETAIAPGKATDPVPANEATGQSKQLAELSWQHEDYEGPSE